MGRAKNEPFAWVQNADRQRRKIRSTSDHRRETQPKKEGREAFKVKGPSIASKPTTARIVICADESAFDAFGRDGS